MERFELNAAVTLIQGSCSWLEYVAHPRGSRCVWPKNKDVNPADWAGVLTYLGTSVLGDDWALVRNAGGDEIVVFKTDLLAA